MDQVTEVKQKTDIIEIIGNYVKLTRAGKHYKALCPFHSEKTASFTVSPELQIFKCFGCGESGDVYSFLEKHEGMEFGEALRFLAERVGIKLVALNPAATTEKERLKEINKIAASFYHYLLVNHKVGKTALDYLTTERKLTADSIKTFCLGYAPNMPNSLVNFLRKRKYFLQDIEKAGLSAYGKDRFRERIIFPLYNNSGEVVALAGRIMPNYPNKNVGKYINSPETPIYHKGSMLYGFHLTRSDIKKAGYAVIVEGELDLISSYQVGVKNIVAIKGSALTEDQLRVLSRLTNRIVLALDSDFAGDSAARRGITAAQSMGLALRVMVAEKYKDPDDFARADPKGYKKALRLSVGVWDYIIDSIFSKYKTLSAENKAAIGREIVPILASIPDEIVRAHFEGETARRLGVPVDAIEGELAKKTSEKILTVEVKKPKLQKTRQEKDEEEAMRLGFLIKPEVLLKEKVGEVLTNPVYKRLFEELDRFMKKEEWNLKSFSDSLPEELVKGFLDIVMKEIDEFETEKDIVSPILRLRESAQKRQAVASLRKN